MLLNARDITKGNCLGIMISMTVFSDGCFERPMTLLCLIIGTGKLSYSVIAEAILTTV